MFVATTSINKNCLYSFSLPLSLSCALSTCCSLLLRDAHTQKQAASRDSLYVQYAEPANIAAYFLLLSLRPLFAAAFYVVCPLLCVLSCAARFRHYVALVDCGTAALRQTSRVFVFRACPKPTRRCSSCAIDPTAAQLTTSLPTATATSAGASAAVIYCVYF